MQPLYTSRDVCLSNKWAAPLSWRGCSPGTMRAVCTSANHTQRRCLQTVRNVLLTTREVSSALNWPIQSLGHSCTSSLPGGPPDLAFVRLTGAEEEKSPSGIVLIAVWMQDVGVELGKGCDASASGKQNHDAEEALPDPSRAQPRAGGEACSPNSAFRPEWDSDHTHRACPDHDKLKQTQRMFTDCTEG